jgi:hypothetical protein
MKLKKKNFTAYRQEFLKSIEKGERDSLEDLFNGVWEKFYKERMKENKIKGSKKQAKVISNTNWWNKDGKHKRSKECPGEGWKIGRIMYSWWNNGKEQKQSELQPDKDWSLGRLPLPRRKQTDITKKKISEVQKKRYNKI